MGDAELLNADGYTTLYNHDTVGKGPGGIQGYIKGKYAAPVAPNAHLNGFKRFATTEAGNTRNAFYAGKYAVASYEVDKPSGPFILGYAVDAHWAPPKNKPVVDPMTDFGPDANCPEPWKISLSAVPIGDGLTEVGGQATLTIDVYDRTGKNSHHSPLAECPELFNGTVSATFKQDFTGYARYEATVSNTKLAVAGQYRCLVSVEDNANSSSPAWLDLTAYQMIKLTVNQKPNEPPVASADAAKTVVNIMEDILFTDTSTDPDGYSDIVKWEWDLSYVEAQGFHNDHSGSWDIYHYSVAGVYQVQLRVTDSASHTDMLDTPITITVNYINLPPNVKAKADKLKIPAGGTVQFTDQSTDPDGPADMVKWEWDFSYWADDGFNVDSSLKNPTHQFNTAGLYVVMLKVTDTADNVGWLFPYPINITVQ
jgi:PKD repeat protein